MTQLQARAVVGKYKQKSCIARMEAFFLENVGKIATSAQIQEVAKDPMTGKEPENWHQRLSELRVNSGYTILSKRDKPSLGVGQYILESIKKREGAGKRVICSKATWQKVLARAGNRCEWKERGETCGLENGNIDSVGGGTVQLTADHMTPHSLKSAADSEDVTQWQALCGRHQIVKRNYWDNATGKLNLQAIIQAASVKEKRAAFKTLNEYFKPKVSTKQKKEEG